MLNINFTDLFVFILATVFTPGPNNISSASMGILYGYKLSLKYIFGICCGFFMMMFTSSLISSSLLLNFPILEKMIRYFGALYIIYLAINLLKSSYQFTNAPSKPLQFSAGLFLQIFNPKTIVFGFTVFSVFFASYTTDYQANLMIAFLLSITAFTATSIWALFGSIIKSYLHRPIIKNAMNLTLSLLLVFTAFQIAFL